MDITKFCAGSNDVRSYLSRPIQLDRCVAGSDGQICIFDTCPSYSAIKDGVPASILVRVQEIFNECLAVQNWTLHKPQPLPEKLDCTYCGGTGKLTKQTCPECEGACFVDFENDFNSYVVDCDTCNAKGTTKVHKEPFPTCEACNGEKQLWDWRVSLIVEGILLSPHYYSLIRDLPNLEIAAKDEHMLYFKSGKYIGAVMGMRQ